jgi:hypothetical protein
VTALSVSPPSAVTAPVPVAGAEASPGETTAAAEPTPTATTVAATPGAPTSLVYSLDISATVTGSPTALITFLDQLQSVQPRAVLITKITEAAATSDNGGPAGNSMTLQLTMQAYVAPDTPAATPSVSVASS